MASEHRARSLEMVTVIGPVDTAPGKKMTYPARQIKRGQAESRGARRLGIQIVPDGATKVTVDHTQKISYEGQVDPRDAKIAELEAMVKQLFEASQKKKPGRKPKVKADAAEA